MGEAGSILQAHQNVVAGRSPVWDAMLNHDMREAQTAKLTLADVDERFFKPFLYLLYTGELPADLANPKPDSSESESELQTVLGMLVLADRFQVPGFGEVFETCLRQLMRFDSSMATGLMTWAGLPRKSQYCLCLVKAASAAAKENVDDTLQQVEERVLRQIPADTINGIAARANVFCILTVKIWQSVKGEKERERLKILSNLLLGFASNLQELPDPHRQRKRQRCDAPE